MAETLPRLCYQVKFGSSVTKDGARNPRGARSSVTHKWKWTRALGNAGTRTLEMGAWQGCF